MRFRLGINGGGGGGTDPLVGGVSRGLQTLFMAPMLQAQAADQFQSAEAKRRLMDSEQRAADAHAALYGQQAEAGRRQLDRQTMPEMTRTALMMNQVSPEKIGEATQFFQTGQLPDLYNKPGDGVGPTVPQPDYADTSGLGGRIMQTLGLLRGGLTNGGNIEQVTAAGNNLQKQDANRGVQSGQLDPVKVAQAFYATDGKAPFSFHEFGTGNNLTGAVDDTGGPASRFAQYRNQQTATQRSLEQEHQAQARSADALTAQRRDGPMGAAANPDVLLSNEDAKFMAQQYLQGDTSVMTNLGRGAQGAQNIVKMRRAIVQEAQSAGMSPAQVAAAVARFQGDKAAFRAAGTRSAAVEMAATEADQVADLALQASQGFDRTSFVPVNKAIRFYQTNTGDPAVVQFGAANLALINTYARAISPTGQPTIHDKQHAEELLSTAFTPEQYAATVAQMKREIDAARRSPGAVRDSMSSRMTGGGAGAPAASDPLGIRRK